jgi:soluble lytic murein transglycosylase-like protein
VELLKLNRWSRRPRTPRRRITLRGLALTALTFVFPHVNVGLVGLPALLVAPAPTPTVTIVEATYEPVPARRLYDRYVSEASRRYGVDAALIRAVLQAESRYNALAASPSGALGLMQLMPPVLETYGVRDPFDPRENIMAGTRYLRRLLDLHGGDVRLALASYNAGPAAVEKYGDIPPFEETRNYVTRVTDLLATRQ